MIENGIDAFDTASGSCKPRVTDYAVPAVVILGGLNGLGVVRSLARGDVRSHVVDRGRFSPAMWSRRVKQVLAPTLQGREFVDLLLDRYGERAERPVLFNTHEMSVLTISEHRNKLQSAFRFRMPPHDMVLALQDKARFHELAIARGLPVPRSEIIDAASEIAGKLRRLRLPIVVKPADKATVHTGLASGVTVFARFEDAVAGCEKMLESAGELIAQEWVDGANNEIYFCLFYRGRGGRIVSMFTGRKLASIPPGVGLTAYCTAAPEACRTLEPLTEAFLERVDYAGMGSVEYKWDKTSGRFAIIEPTVGRSDWQEEIATLCGANIPLDAYRHEMDLPADRAEAPRKTVVWRSSIFERVRTERPAFPPDAQIYDGYWRADDPLPAFIHYSYGALTAAVRRLAK